MTRAPIAQQRLLIDLQALDSQAARLAHERKNLPVLARIEDTVTRLRVNKRDAVVAGAALVEARSTAAYSEREVDQVVRRAAVLRERLAAGAAGARDLSAIQGEIDQLGRRQGVLEEAQLAAEEALESAQAEVARIAEQEKTIRADGRELTAQRDAAFARIDADCARAQRDRDELAATIDPALLAEYDAVRTATGGLGAVALRGSRFDGPGVEMSPAELARVRAADEDLVIHAEDNDVIIVRMDS